MTAELAVLEKFVHSEGDEPDLVLVAVDVPDDPALGVDMPITGAVCRVLDEPAAARTAVQELLQRAPKAEYCN